MTNDPAAKPPTLTPTVRQEMLWYKRGFIVLLVFTAFLAGFLTHQLYNSSQKSSGGAFEAPPTPRIFLMASPTPKSEDEETVVPPSTVSLTPTPKASLLTSSVCPVTFTVPGQRVLVPATGEYGTWQLREGVERFFFLPRSEETNGKYVVAEFRVEGKGYTYGDAEIRVGCQDNANHWSQSDFLTYVLKADEIKDTQMTKTMQWGKEIGVLTYTPTYDISLRSTVRLFATPTKLVHVASLSKDQYKDLVNDVFLTLTFR